MWWGAACSRRLRRLGMVLFLLAGLAVALWPVYGPALAGAAVRHALDRAGFPGSDCHVLRLTPWTAEFGPVRLGMHLDAPACRQITVTFSPGSLLRGRVDRVDLDGVRILLQRTPAGTLALAGLPAPPRPVTDAGTISTVGWNGKIPLREFFIRNVVLRVETEPGRFQEWTGLVMAAEERQPGRFRLKGWVMQGGRSVIVRCVVTLPQTTGSALAVTGDVHPVLLPGDLPSGVQFSGPLPTLPFQLTQNLSSAATGRVELALPRMAVALTPSGVSVPATLSGAVTLSASWDAAGVAGEFRLNAAEAALPAAEFAVRGLAFRQPFTAGGTGGWSLGTGSGSWQSCTWRGLDLACREFRSEPAPAGAALVLKVQPQGSVAAPAVRAVFRRDAESAGVTATVVAELPDTIFLEGDALTTALLRDAGGWVFSGTVGGRAEGEWRPGQPVTSHGEVRLAGAQARNDGKAVSISGIDTSVTLLSLLPVRSAPAQTVRFREVRLEKPGKVQLGPGELIGQAELPDRFFLERGEVGWSGGKLRTYALHINRLRPEGQALLYAENIDIGGVLGLFRGFTGKGAGRLFGRIPLQFSPNSIRLEDAYLYVPPGQGGTLELNQTGWMKDTLSASGASAGTVSSVQKALADFKFNVFRVDLEGAASGEAVLRLQLKGRARQDEDLPPVDLNLNIHAPFQALFDLGMQLAPAAGR